MRVFLSWSGDTSKEIATVLHDWLTLVFPDITLWLSTRSIEAGQRWGEELDEQLATTTFGILCLVPSNLKSPWLLFEAGALSRSVQAARVVPYCLGLSPDDLSGPLSRFQGVAADKRGTRKLVESINAVLPIRRSDGVLERTFEKWWPELEKALAGMPALDVRGPETVRVQRVVCASTVQFEKLGASEDMDVIEANYPNAVTRLHAANSEHLRNVLTAGYFEIAHLLGYVDPRTGDFVFGEHDRLPAAGLLKLLQLARTQLLFLATCDSLTLGAILSRNMSVIAASDWVEADAMIKWERCFYEVLAKGQTLATAYDLAQATTDLPMRLLMRTDAIFLPAVLPHNVA